MVPQGHNPNSLLTDSCFYSLFLRFSVPVVEAYCIYCKYHWVLTEILTQVLVVDYSFEQRFNRLALVLLLLESTVQGCPANA